MVMSKKYVLQHIRKEYRRCYKRPVHGMPKIVFDQITMHNWAVEEILRQLGKLDESAFRYTNMPCDIVEMFIKKMDEYACASKENSHWFSAARDAGEWVLDILISL